MEPFTYIPDPPTLPRSQDPIYYITPPFLPHRRPPPRDSRRRDSDPGPPPKNEQVTRRKPFGNEAEDEETDSVVAEQHSTPAAISPPDTSAEHHSTTAFISSPDTSAEHSTTAAVFLPDTSTEQHSTTAAIPLRNTSQTPPNLFYHLYMPTLFSLPDRYCKDAPPLLPTSSANEDATQAVYNRWVTEWIQMTGAAGVLGYFFTVLQIPSASDDLVVHTVVWLSMACLCFGVLYAVILGFEFRKFGNKAEGNKTKALDWIREVTLPPTNNFWNPRIMLSMPAVWIIWGVIYFAVFMISFLWRTDEKGEDSEPSPIQQKGPRVVTTVIGFVGAVYLGLIIRDLKRIESGGSRRTGYHRL